MALAKFILWFMLVYTLSTMGMTWDKFVFWVIMLNVWALTRINMIQVIDQVIQLNRESNNTNE